MDDSELVERVAEAIYRERYGSMGWKLATKRGRQHCVSAAVASIEAVRAYHAEHGPWSDAEHGPFSNYDPDDDWWLQLPSEREA